MMTTSSKPSSPLRASRGLLVPLGLVVLLTLLYMAGMPWAVVALDRFWERVDRLAEHPRLMSFFTALSWAVAVFFVYRFYLWDKRVSSALEAVVASTPAGQQLGWRSLSHLATAGGLPKNERAWLSAVVDELYERGANPPSTFPVCEHCGRG